jgi:tripartite-type tricarboxylate transporter receptor subunit TctC
MLPRDFLPVGSLAAQPMFICASAASGIKTLPDLIERAKQQPGKISFAATGIGRITHLTGLLLQSRAGIELQALVVLERNQADDGLLAREYRPSDWR